MLEKRFMRNKWIYYTIIKSWNDMVESVKFYLIGICICLLLDCALLVGAVEIWNDFEPDLVLSA